MSWKTKHFASEEFDSPDLPGSGEGMDKQFIALLELIREDCGFAFRINSGFRTPARNKGAGGVEDSAHTRGKGCDIAVHGSASRFRLVESALKHGINRIGVASSFVHLDLDETKASDVMWFYTTSGARV